MEEAAICVHTFARHNLGIMEGKNGRPDRAVKHLIIVAKLGQDQSLSSLRRLYAEGIVSKEDLAGALRAHQDAVEETKSQQREAAEAARTDRVK